MTGRERVENGCDGAAGLFLNRFVQRCGRRSIFDRVAELQLGGCQWRIDRIDGRDGWEQLFDFVFGKADGVRDFLRKRGASQLLGDLGPCEERLAHLRYAVHRDTDRARFLGERATNPLLDPVSRESRKTRTHGGVETIDRSHQAETPFLNQVDEVEAASAKSLGDPHDEPQVALDESLPDIIHLGDRFGERVAETPRRQRGLARAPLDSRQSSAGRRGDRPFGREHVEYDGATVLAL